MMKRSIIAMILCLVAFACTRQEMDTDAVKIGEPAMLSLKITSSDMVDVETRGIKVEDEQKIDHMIVLAFYPDGKLVSRSEFLEINDDDVINAYTTTGTGIDVYIIANYKLNDELRNSLLEVATLDELMSLKFYPLPHVLEDYETPDRLMMVGVLKNQTITPGYNTLTVNMEYVCAKVTIKYVDNTSTHNVKFTEGRVMNMGSSTYLCDHDGVDCLDRTSGSTFFNSVSVSFEETDVSEGGKETNRETLYLCENLSGGRKSVEKPADMPQTLWDSYLGKSACAPEYATYAELSFNGVNAPSELADFLGISKDDKTYMFKIKLYFGGDSSSDFNIKRGHHYTCTVTMNDDWDISVAITDVDSNTSGTTSPIKIISGSSLNMDANSCSRSISFMGDPAEVENLKVEILDEEGRRFYENGFDATWLKLSSMNTKGFQVSQNAPNNLWQQEAPGEGYFVRGKFIPNKVTRMWLENPDAAPQTETYTDDEGIEHVYTVSPVPPRTDVESPRSYSPPTGIVIGSEEFPDNDCALPWSKSNFRMCYELNHMLDPSMTGEQTYAIYTYSDEHEWDGSKHNTQKSRTARILISYDNMSNGQREGIEYIVRQSAPLFIGTIMEDATNEEHSILLEQIEECKSVFDPSYNTSLQNTCITQWGHYGELLYTGTDGKQNGYFLTANAVYNDVGTTNGGEVNANGRFDSYTWDGNNYRDKYGSGRFREAIKSNDYAKITEPSVDFVTGGTYGNSGAPYYFPKNKQVPAAINDSFNALFNSSAAMECHQKNADIDGDGKISPWETDWYLPSYSELMMVFVAFETIQVAGTSFTYGYYWSSSERDKNIALLLGFATGYSESNLKKIMNGGTETVSNYSEVLSKKDGSLRCMRMAHDHLPSSFSIENGNPYLDFTNLSSDAYVNTSKGSATGVNDTKTDRTGRWISKNSATVFAKLRIGKHDVSGPGATMSWREAVGYPEVFAGSVGSKTVVSEPDARLGLGAVDLSGQKVNNYCSLGVPATEATGCNAYYEDSPSEIGTWRLPNKREQMMMWIYKEELLEVVDSFNNATYWNATERASSPDGASFKYQGTTLAWTTAFGINGENKSISKDDLQSVRCVKEVYTSIEYKMYYHTNGGYGGPGTVMCYGDTPTTVLPGGNIKHPDGKAFFCWNTRADGTGTNYAPGSVYKMGHGNATLYAIWK